MVQQPYAVDVYDEFVVRGNTAVLRCRVPAQVQDYVTVTSWIRDGSFVIRPTALAGKCFGTLSKVLNYLSLLGKHFSPGTNCNFYAFS